MLETLVLNKKIYNFDKTRVGIFTLWLFHVSAMIGMSIGYFEWFISKTPLNLMIGALLLLYLFPINSKKTALPFLICIGVGIFSEWLGVQYGLIFGNYEYGQNLGLKMDGVPWLIGVNWAVLIFITANIAQKWTKKTWLRPIIGTLLMLFLDFFMEGVAPIFDFWTFTGGVAPLQNYIGWFGIALLLQIIYQSFKVKGNYRMSKQFYLCQLAFFIYFYAIYSI